MAKVGIVGSKYGVVQPMSMWTIFDGMDVEWEQVGSLRGGAVLYAVAKIARFDVVKGDEVEQLMLLWQALDGSGSVRVLGLQKRMFCMNVMGGLVGKHGNGVSIRHTRFAEQRLNFAARALRKCQEDAVRSQELFKQLASTRFSGKQFAELCEKLIPDAERDPKTGEFLTNNTQRENNRATLQAHYEHGMGQDHPGVAGTASAGVSTGVARAPFATFLLENTILSKNWSLSAEKNCKPWSTLASRGGHPAPPPRICTPVEDWRL